jgi:hypothetical protein
MEPLCLKLLLGGGFNQLSLGQHLLGFYGVFLVDFGSSLFCN